MANIPCIKRGSGGGGYNCKRFTPSYTKTASTLTINIKANLPDDYSKIKLDGLAVNWNSYYYGNQNPVGGGYAYAYNAVTGLLTIVDSNSYFGVLYPPSLSVLAVWEV